MKINNKIFIYLTLFTLTSTTILHGQQKLSLQEAVSIALKNNYDIKLVNNNLATAKNNISIGNAGMLPNLSANFNTSASNQNTVQTLASGTQRIINGANSTNTSYGVGLGWTIFDGLQMFTNYERLQELKKQGEILAKTTVLTTIADVITSYYDLAKQQQLLLATDSAIVVSKLRLKIANNKLQIGRGSKLDVLSAKVDYNADTSAYLLQKNLFKTSAIRLNQIMARDLNLTFTVDAKIDLEKDLELATLINKTEQLNPDLQNALLNKKLAALNLKQVKGARYPQINFNTGYEFFRNANPTGFNQKFRANGLTYGIATTFNIFNGNLQKQNEKNAKIAINSSDINVARTRQDINAQLISAYQNYTTYLGLVKLEGANLDIAKQNLDITIEKYRLGSITPLELREAQKNALDAITRSVEVQFQAKLTEINLKEISGTINIQ